MKFSVRMLVAVVLFAPALAAAQTRPSNTMHTNSASLYLDRARKTTNVEEKKDLLEKALGFALDGIKAKADNPRAYLLAGQISVQLGDAVAADSMFDRAEQLWPEFAKETERERMMLWAKAYNAGVTALRANNMDEALAHFEQADAVYAKQPGAKLNLAQIYARKEQNEKAIAAYKGALDILRGPGRQGLKAEDEAQWKEFEELATFNMATLLATTGKNEEAAALYREYLARDPDNTQAKSNLAVVLRRLGNAEEAAKVFSDLSAGDLSAAEHFNVGVDLFRTSQFVQAADAFRKALGKNPHMRDASYNLAQTLYSLAAELQEQKAKASGAAATALNTRLTQVYTEIGEVTSKLRTIDPANRNVMALQSRAYRGLGDLTADAVSANWKNKTLEVLKANEALNIEVQDVSMGSAGGEVQIAGSVVNAKAKAGDTVKLRVYFLGANGQSLGTQDVTVTLPEIQGATPFRVSLKPSAEVVGWKYEILP